METFEDFRQAANDFIAEAGVGLEEVLQIFDDLSPVEREKAIWWVSGMLQTATHPISERKVKQLARAMRREIVRSLGK